MEPGTASYVPDEGAYILNKCSPEKLSAIATALKNSRIDVSEFEQKISEYAPYYTQVENQAVDARKVIQAEDASEDTKFLLSIDYPEYYDLKEELKYYVTCAFPTYGSHEHDMNRQPRVGPDGAPMDSMEPEGMRVAHDTNQKWYLYGSFDDFYQFGSMLKNLGWDVTQYISKIENLMQKNVLNIRMFNDKQRFTGALDGYEKTRKVKLPDGTEKELQLRNEDGTLAYDKDKFDSNIDNSVQEDIKLYDKQKDGIRWLYSRESAILGDDTGTGKTLTSAVTALMRSRPEGKILIVTKKELIFQWAREINTKLLTPADKICICLPKLKTGNASKSWKIIIIERPVSCIWMCSQIQ